MEKIFDPKGDLRIVFKKDRIEQITEWLNKNNTPLEEALKYAKEVHVPVFGKALRFPCKIKYSL